MHLYRLREANRPAHKALDPRAQRQMLALNLLRVAFARLMLICFDMTPVSTPVVRIIARDTKRFEQRFELEEYLILAASKHIGQHLGRPNRPSSITHFLDRLIWIKNPINIGASGKNDQAHVSGLEFSPKTAFLDGLCESPPT